MTEKEKEIKEEKIKNQKLNEILTQTQKQLEENENIIKKEKNENQRLMEELSKIKNFISEKEIMINDEKTKNQKLKEELMDYKNKINEEKKKLEELNNKIKNYQDIIVNEQKDEKMLKLFDDLELKDNEIKKLNEMKSRFPFELLENEKLMTVIIQTGAQDIHYAIICKNTQKFTEIEHKLYEEYPEYLESENYFLFSSRKINKYKTLEENTIKNIDLIILSKYGEDE